ncbi:hypothetical protein PVAP13_3KG120381 [Panicum virgatum]|uniref:Uncharacterized protein n=1 Tax=Panicum virgatum TaxID=38727 RepID=A0A8T0UNT6_PANVG|nr:hypothetical protein PVAP13_3KG120381 [Panicum virgatum]
MNILFFVLVVKKKQHSNFHHQNIFLHCSFSQWSWQFVVIQLNLNLNLPICCMVIKGKDLEMLFAKKYSLWFADPSGVIEIAKFSTGVIPSLTRWKREFEVEFARDILRAKPSGKHFLSDWLSSFS